MYASFNNPERILPLHCSRHRGPRMINVRARVCVAGCKSKATHADPRYPGAAIVCSRHSTAGMVRVLKKGREAACAEALPSAADGN